MEHEYLHGRAFVKKSKGKIQIFETPYGLGDFVPAVAEGTTMPRMLKDRFADVVNVKDFGAVGDGIHDDTAAIQSALKFAKENNRLCVAQGRFFVSQTIEIDSSCDFSEAEFSAHGVSVIPVVTVGQKEATHSTMRRGIKMRLPRVVNLDRKGTSFDGIESSIAVQVLNLFCAEVHVGEIKDFYRGLYITASQTGNAWNKYYLSSFTENRFNLDIYPTGTGWVNQNQFFGGRFYSDSQDVSAKCTQLRISKENSKSRWGVNCNSFFGCDFSGRNVDYAIDNSGGCYNNFFGCRFEDSVKVRYKTDSSDGFIAYNNIFGGLGTETLQVEIDKSAGGVIRNNDICSSGRHAYDFFSTDNFLAIGRQLKQGVFARCYVGKDVTQAKASDLDWLFDISDKGISTKKYYTTPNAQVTLSDRVSLSSGQGTNNVTVGQLYDKNVVFGGTSLESVSPETTESVSLGKANRLWAQLFASTATINTSDEREKTSIASPEEALMRAWGKINFKVFQFKDAVEKKGIDARLHVGVIAQEVKVAFESEGLDATRYGLLCYDKWGDEYEDIEIIDQVEVADEEGRIITPQKTHIEHRLVTHAGDRYGIRYEEALALEAAYQRWRMDKLEAALIEKGVKL